MNILLLGSGGREHTLAWKMKQSALCNNLYIAPGNAGTESIGTNVELSNSDFSAIKSFCVTNQIDILVVGPEAPLVDGIQDFFSIELPNLAVIGPSAQAAQLEGSKAFAKQFMEKYNIPTAGYKEFTKHNFEEGLLYIEEQKGPIVLKADGLAAGKGVIITEDIIEAKKAFTEMIQKQKFGTASSKVVIEDFLDGIELSIFALTDGKNYVLLPNAKDYKRIGEGDKGLNTGGMGAISPVPFATDDFLQKIENKIVRPTIQGIAQEQMDYKGFVFFGLIKVGDEPFVIEYNCRMGDPETEVVIPRLNSDLVELFKQTADHKLNEANIQISNKSCSTVILVSGGYPEKYEKGKNINGLEAVNDNLVFHAGTKKEAEQIKTNGGRVLALSAFGKDLKDALNKSYAMANTISFEGKYFRKDIGYEFI